MWACALPQKQKDTPDRLKAIPLVQELKEMRRAGVRTFAEAENYEADRKRRALEEGGARGDRAYARHRGRVDEDDPAILAQVLSSTLFFLCSACLVFNYHLGPGSALQLIQCRAVDDGGAVLGGFTMRFPLGAVMKP